MTLAGSSARGMRRSWQLSERAAQGIEGIAGIEGFAGFAGGPRYEIVVAIRRSPRGLVSPGVAEIDGRWGVPNGDPRRERRTPIRSRRVRRSAVIVPCTQVR